MNEFSLFHWLIVLPVVLLLFGGRKSAISEGIIAAMGHRIQFRLPAR